MEHTVLSQPQQNRPSSTSRYRAKPLLWWLTITVLIQKTDGRYDSLWGRRHAFTPFTGVRVSHRSLLASASSRQDAPTTTCTSRDVEAIPSQKYINDHDQEYDALLEHVKFYATSQRLDDDRANKCSLHVSVLPQDEEDDTRQQQQQQQQQEQHHRVIHVHGGHFTTTTTTRTTASRATAYAATAAPPPSPSPTTSPRNNKRNQKYSRGGASTAAAAAVLAASQRPLVFWENMVCGAVSRSIAQTVMHPANTMKTIMQSTRGPDRPSLASLARPDNFSTLTRGAGANFVLSVPHGAINFAVLEYIRFYMSKLVERTPWMRENADKLGPGLDFLSSALSTVCCSVVSTPQMMITDNIMAGNYPNLPGAIRGLASDRGLKGFYAGWWPGLAGKIPSYALTWTLFQQLKQAQLRVFQRPPKDIENSIMGCIASGTTVCIMIPMDTIKTRLVTQTSRAISDPYNGIIDCAVRVFREEGVGAFYRGLAPRLVSVVPMIGIQFGVYEFAKKMMLQRVTEPEKKAEPVEEESYGDLQAFEEAAMEVAADNEQPFPAPHFKNKYQIFRKNNGKSKKKKQRKPRKEKVQQKM